LAQNARNCWYTVQVCSLPFAQGTFSTVTPQCRQSMRRMQYHSHTANPHSGTNAKPRGVLAVSYVGPGCSQIEQRPREPLRGITATWIDVLSSPK
jgi:hypothetical protein